MRWQNTIFNNLGIDLGVGSHQEERGTAQTDDNTNHLALNHATMREDMYGLVMTMARENPQSSERGNTSYPCKESKHVCLIEKEINNMDIQGNKKVEEVAYQKMLDNLEF